MLTLQLDEDDDDDADDSVGDLPRGAVQDADCSDMLYSVVSKAVVDFD